LAFRVRKNAATPPATASAARIAINRNSHTDVSPVQEAGSASQRVTARGASA
jgi:hypothetical protein